MNLKFYAAAELALILFCGVHANAAPAEDPAAQNVIPAQGEETRTIHLLQDDAQVRMATRLYELKHVKAADIRPYIQAAIKRYSTQSRIERVNYSAAKKTMLLITTGEDFLPFVDDLIAKLDRPGKLDEYGSMIESTGVTRIVYHPNYRAAEDIVLLINKIFRSCEGLGFLNKTSNIIYWKDDKLAALSILAWVQYLDRPLPQVNLRLNYYEVRESKLRDIGLDYLAWKNGPGMNIFNAAYNGGKLFSNEAVEGLLTGAASKFVDFAGNFSSSWGYGGFFTAPQFDMSFLRVLQQSGNAKIVASTDLSFVNTPYYNDANRDQNKTYSTSLTPDYQNIRKDDNDRTDVVPGGSAAFAMTVTNPVICFEAGTGEIDPLGKIPATEEFYKKNNGGVLFGYTLTSRDVVERNNRGVELGNACSVNGEMTLGFKTEKLLTSYIRETEAEQTIGIPFLVKIPVLKYLFGTTTTLKEKTYIFVTAEANLIHPDLMPPPKVSREVLEEEMN